MAGYSHVEGQEVNKELKCPVCLDIFKTPKLLKCRHTFCEECISQLIDAAKNEVVCPSCREITQVGQGASSLFTNYVVKGVVEKLQSANSVPMCHDCVKPTAAVKHCKNCKLNLCSICVQYHQRSIRFVNHILADIAEIPASAVAKSSRYCSKHHELLKYYCDHCKGIVCNDCMLSESHRQHSFRLVDEVKAKIKKEINEIIVNGLDHEKKLDATVQDANKFLKKAEKDQKEALDMVDQLFDDLEKCLKTKKQQIVDRIKKPLVTDSLESTKKKIQGIKDILGYAKSISNEYEVTEYLEMVDLHNQMKVYFDDLGIENRAQSRTQSLPQQQLRFEDIMQQIAREQQQQQQQQQQHQKLFQLPGNELIQWNIKAFHKDLGECSIDLKYQIPVVKNAVKDEAIQYLVGVLTANGRSC